MFNEMQEENNALIYSWLSKIDLHVALYYMFTALFVLQQFSTWEIKQEKLKH
jgi:hypothetical protein